MTTRTLIAAALAAAAILSGCRSPTPSDSAGSATKSTSRSSRLSRAPSEVHIDRVLAGGVPPTTTVPTTNPVAGDSLSIAEGAQLFTAMNCDGCHGGGATGWVGPSLSDGRWRYGGADAEVFRSIYYGQPKGMPAYGGVLQPVIVWKLVAYLKSLPLPKDVPTESW